MKPNNHNRREFIKASVIGAAGITVGGAGFSAKSYASIAGANDRIHVWFALRQVMTSTPDLVEAVTDAARRYDTGIHIHLAEHLREAGAADRVADDALPPGVAFWEAVARRALAA